MDKRYKNRDYLHSEYVIVGCSGNVKSKMNIVNEVKNKWQL